MRYIDLFAGLGGFHVALSNLGHECVFACEKDPTLRTLYTENFCIECNGDIKHISEDDIPAHDILCAGFPCQPFSKAGKQEGLNDIGRGDLIYDILRILRYHRPQYIILENVPNLKKHDREKTWILIQKILKEIGYDVREEILSPHQFGVPQLRKRIFIVGCLGVDSLVHFQFPAAKVDPELNIRKVLDVNPPQAKKLNLDRIQCLELWQKVIDVIPKETPLILPFWGMEFNASYPLTGKSPHKLSSAELGNFRGSFGKSLKGLKKREQIALLPSYARYKESKFPEWKKQYITSIRTFINTHYDLLAPLLTQLEQYPSSWQKLEWNCGTEERQLFNYLIQFRASGIRIKRTNYSPALVIASTQLPVIGWEKRYLTLLEAARLQGLQNINLPNISASAFRALGNAVNVNLVELIMKNLLAVPGIEEREPDAILTGRETNVLSMAVDYDISFRNIV